MTTPLREPVRPPPRSADQRRLRDDPVWRLVGVAALLGLVLRVAWGLWAHHPPQGLYDPARYAGYARMIAAGEGMTEPMSGHPTAYYPPGYPWFLGIVTWLGRPVSDDVSLIGALVQAVLGSATVVFGAISARRLAGPRSAVVAAFGLALYPNLIFHSGALLGETLYNFLFLGFCALVLTVPWPEGLGTRRVLGSGVVLGLAVLVRPISLAVLPVVVAAWWLASRDRRVVLRASLLLVAGVAACLLPWTARNAVRMHQFIPISTNTGDNLCIGHAAGANGAFSASEACRTDYDFLQGPADEVGADREKTRIALRAIADDPGREPWLLWRRFWFIWVRDGDHDGVLAVQSYRLDRFIDPTTEARLARAADIAYWIVVASGLAGLVGLARRRRPEDLFVVGSAVMTALVPLAFFGDSRFKVPVIPLLIVIAATLAEGSRRRTGDRDPASDPVARV